MHTPPDDSEYLSGMRSIGFSLISDTVSVCEFKDSQPTDSRCRHLLALGLALLEGAQLFEILNSSPSGEHENFKALFDGGETKG